MRSWPTGVEGVLDQWIAANEVSIQVTVAVTLRSSRGDR